MIFCDNCSSLLYNILQFSMIHVWGSHTENGGLLINCQNIYMGMFFKYRLLIWRIADILQLVWSTEEPVKTNRERLGRKQDISGINYLVQYLTCGSDFPVVGLSIICSVISVYWWGRGYVTYCSDKHCMRLGIPLTV